MRRYLEAQTACLIGALILWSPVVGQDSLQIHHIDVDQGDATLLVMPNDRALLIDSGLASRGDEVADFLQAQGITQLDAFLATHYDRDHYGGIPKVVDAGIEVGKWYDRGEKEHVPPDKKDDAEYEDYVANAQPLEQLMPGDTIFLDPSVSLVTVASNGHVRGALGKYDINGLDENGYSVTLLVSYRGFNYLIGGDLTRPVEERLALEAAVGDIDAYHVNHHGSATSSSHAFLQAIRPEVAIVSNGSHGGFNHPRRAVLDTLRMVGGLDIYQTNRLQEQDLDQDDDIVGGNVPTEFIADLESNDSDGTVTIVVRGESYWVEMPAREISRRYQIQE